MEALPDVLYHFFILFSMFDVDGEPLLDFFNFFPFMFPFDLPVIVGRLFDCSEEHLLFVVVDLPHVVPGDLVVEHLVPFVFPEEHI